jgi:hypothetical protein
MDYSKIGWVCVLSS